MYSLLPCTIVSAHWIRDPGKRALGQKVANVKMLCSDPNTANKLLTSDVFIQQQRIALHKDLREPLRCGKCQLYGHIARNCKQEWDTCAICRDRHRTTACTSHCTLKCTACDSDDHASNSRTCPNLLRRLEQLDQRDPERSLPYFPTEEAWTWQQAQAPRPPPRYDLDLTRDSQEHVHDRIPKRWQSKITSYQQFDNRYKRRRGSRNTSKRGSQEPEDTQEPLPTATANEQSETNENDSQ
jgi:hypothetical protein